MENWGGYLTVGGIKRAHRILREPDRETDSRNGVMALLGGAMNDGAHRGALIRGEIGSGRRSLANDAAQEYAPDRTRINVVGTRYGRDINYGAVLFLLARLTPSQIASVGGILGGLVHDFKDHGKPPLVFVEHSEELDPLSASLLAQLALQEAIFIVVISDNARGTNAELASLMRATDLLVLDTGPLSLPEAMDYMTGILGGKASAFSVAILWSAAEGNQSWLEALTRESIATGLLINRDSTWVFLGDRVPLGGLVSQLAQTRISRLTTAERRLIQMLAMNGKISTRELSDEFSAELDSLYGAGYIQASLTHSGMTQLSSRMLKWTLRESLHEQCSSKGSNVPQDSKITFSEMQTRLLHFSPGNLSGLVESCERESMRLNRAGRNEESRDLVEDFHRCLCEVPDTVRQTDEWASANIDLLLLRSELAAGVGDLKGLEAMAAELDLLGLHESFSSLTDAQRCRMAAQSAEFQALHHGQLQAVDSVNLVLADAGFSGRSGGQGFFVNPRHTQGMIGSLFCALVASGQSQYARGLGRSFLSGSYPHPEVIEIAGIWEGILAALDDDLESAVRYLEPAWCQGQLNKGNAGTDYLRGIIAYCHVDSGRISEASELLSGEGSTSVVNTAGIDIVRAIGEIFKVLAIARLNSIEAAQNRIIEAVAQSEHRELPVVQLYLLATAARLGCPGATEKLAERAAHIQGPLAESLRVVADGMMLHNSETIGSGLRGLIDAGYSIFADPHHNAFVAGLKVSERRQIVRAVLDHQRESGAVKSHAHQVQPNEVLLEGIPELGLLTQRERDVAVAVVAGMSNQQIAQHSAVSIRTVEGHLYQVYAKLRVKGRRELVTHISAVGSNHAGARK